MYISEYYKEVEPGVFERKEKIFSSEFYANGLEKKEVLRILNSDKGHYVNMVKTIEKSMPGIIGKFENVVSIGGGLPKFETTILKAKNITVIDMIAGSYESQVKEFNKLYNIPNETIIKFQNKEIKVPVKSKKTDAVVFVHFLEHQNTWEDVKKWLELQTSDVIIYGPNIAAAKDDNWIHYGNHKIDHNVFFTIEAIEKAAEKLGYKCESISYSDDMLVWLKVL